MVRQNSETGATILAFAFNKAACFSDGSDPFTTACRGGKLVAIDQQHYIHPLPVK